MEIQGDITTLTDAFLLDIVEKDSSIVEDEGTSGCVECQFIEIQTDKGFLVIANYNDHNGYYGGFDLAITKDKVDT